jgi:hypothetical protein
MGIVDWLAGRLANWTVRADAGLTHPADDMLHHVQGLSEPDAIMEAEAGIASGRVIRVAASPASGVEALRDFHLAQHLLGLLQRFSLIEDPRREVRIVRAELEPWRLGESEFIKLGTARGDHALVLARPHREEILVFDPADTPDRLNDELYPTIFHLLTYVIRLAESS